MDPQRYMRARRMAKRAGPPPDPHPDDGPRDPGELHEMEVRPRNTIRIECPECGLTDDVHPSTAYWNRTCPECGCEGYECYDEDQTDPPDEPHAP